MFFKYISAMLMALFGFCCVASGQIQQDRPELCGRIGVTPVPRNVVAGFEPGVGPTLTVTPTASTAGVRTPLNGRVRQVCVIPSGRYLLFGDTGDDSYQVTILSGDSGSLVDQFDAYNPIVSPDQRWLIRRHFYSGHSEVPFSEEYLLYDLTKDAAGNTVGRPTPYIENMRGRVVYPAVADGAPFEHAAYALTDNQTHVFRSKSFYWSSDGTTVLFADSVKDVLSLVLVVLDPSEPKTLVHTVAPNEACEQGSHGDVKQSWLSLSDGEVDAKGHVVQTRFWSSDEAACRPKLLVLSWSDFVPAPIENHPPVVRTGVPAHRQPSSKKPQ
jgi:hypothetical protein